MTVNGGRLHDDVITWRPFAASLRCETGKSKHGEGRVRKQKYRDWTAGLKGYNSWDGLTHLDRPRPFSTSNPLVDAYESSVAVDVRRSAPWPTEWKKRENALRSKAQLSSAQHSTAQHGTAHEKRKAKIPGESGNGKGG
ncbi:hypothetical protein S7711_10747 [Stachybotrys chartarum IBT 7711]|uniref:Uncharacterized protein n=1 Tax=Stachybotrys chartarum (strain CBS 109288 / IBT 7711) TaxID=1280523 RepID=A0A084B7J8_STACB|nr:hypothetical protein S7711_10747 [Stachybotrys chartarum IBT 7711]KFA48270.1 hypothetical protein S40293_11174 [Stachybotrys chartarum IBT 40293]